MEVANTLSYNDTATINAIKYFMIQASDVSTENDAAMIAQSYMSCSFENRSHNEHLIWFNKSWVVSQQKDVTFLAIN
jgi:hypothetical protein